MENEKGKGQLFSESAMNSLCLEWHKGNYDSIVLLLLDQRDNNFPIY